MPRTARRRAVVQPLSRVARINIALPITRMTLNRLLESYSEPDEVAVCSMACLERRLALLWRNASPHGGTAHQTAVIVAQALAAERQAVSAQELYERLHRAYPRLGLATVYRRAGGPGRSWSWRRDWERTRAYLGIRRVRVRASSPSGVARAASRVEDVDETILRPGLRGIRDRHGLPGRSRAARFLRAVRAGAVASKRRSRSRHAARRIPRSRSDRYAENEDRRSRRYREHGIRRSPRC